MVMMELDRPYYRDAGFLVEEISRWIASRVEEAGARGAVVGVSGGVDSAVAAALSARALGKDRCFGLIMPCESLEEDVEDARAVVRWLGVPHAEVDLLPAYGALVGSIRGSGFEPSQMALANLKPRLRMATLYAFASSLGYLVVGTGNKSELHCGYFTKWGDGGVDLLPLGDCLKGEVYGMALFLGVPRRVIEKAPSAGLWPGQTDEGEMGITYEEIDRFLATGEAAPEVRARIERLSSSARHKLALPPVCRPIPRGEEL